MGNLASFSILNSQVNRNLLKKRMFKNFLFLIFHFYSVMLDNFEVDDKRGAIAKVKIYTLEKKMKMRSVSSGIQ